MLEPFGASALIENNGKNALKPAMSVPLESALWPAHRSQSSSGRTGSAAGDVRRMRTSLRLPYANPLSGSEKATPLCKSGVAGLLLVVAGLEVASVEKWLWTEARIEASFCNVRMRWNRDIARSRRRNGRCEFSARLLSHRPISRYRHDPGPSGQRRRTEVVP